VSELTKCNFCSLQELEAKYGKDNVRVVPARGDMQGWWEAQHYEDEKWISAGHWFMVVTAHCVC
jgi:hypothetical protein